MIEGREPEILSAETLRTFLTITDQAVIFIDLQNNVRFVNSSAERMFGYEPGALLGKQLDVIVPSAMRAAHREGVARVAASKVSRLAGQMTEVKGLRADGTEIPIALSISVYNTPAGTMIGAILRDIAERKARDEHLIRLATRDDVTGLPNRWALNEHIEDMLARGRECSLALLSVDRLAHINDQLGHGAGDDVLRMLALRISRLAPDGCFLARMDGSRFALVIPSADPMTVMRAVTDLVTGVRVPIPLYRFKLRLDASAGVAVAPAHGHDADMLIESAQIADFRSGNGHARLYEPSMRATLTARRSVNDEIPHAFESRQFELYFQPQTDIVTGEVVGAEALLRWRHPERGVLGPNAFLELLETHFLVQEIGDWIIDTAAQAVAGWRRSGLPNGRIAINLFQEQVSAGDLASKILSALKQHELPPEALEIEVTESTALEGGALANRQFQLLRDAGVGVAFDDFGTGQASLNLLRDFPVTKLKIDKSFVAGMTTSQSNFAIVSGLVSIAHKASLSVVAEGVETQDQLAQLRAMQCDIAQGYLFSRPLRAEEFETYCAKGQARNVVRPPRISRRGK